MLTHIQCRDAVDHRIQVHGTASILLAIEVARGAGDGAMTEASRVMEFEMLIRRATLPRSLFGCVDGDCRIAVGQSAPTGWNEESDAQTYVRQSDALCRCGSSARRHLLATDWLLKADWPRLRHSTMLNAAETLWEIAKRLRGFLLFRGAISRLRRRESPLALPKTNHGRALG